MSDTDPSAVIRSSIESELKRRDQRVTPQALNALVGAVMNSSRELVGDSDSLLLGLLGCGSYTLDILRDAGADIDHLNDDASSSAASYVSPFADSDIDPIETLFGEAGSFGRLTARPELRGRAIETSDLLQEAVSPMAERHTWRTARGFQFEEARTERKTLRVADELRVVVDEAIYELCRYIWVNPEQSISNRQAPLSSSEIIKLRKSLSFNRGNIPAIVRAINRLIQRRELPMDDSEFVEIAVAVTSLPSARPKRCSFKSRSF